MHKPAHKPLNEQACIRISTQPTEHNLKRLHMFQGLRGTRACGELGERIPSMLIHQADPELAAG